MAQESLIRLQCGKVGKESAAAKFAVATLADDFSIEEDKPYAELWMGTHPSLPSRDLATKRSLLEIVQGNQGLISQDISRQYGEKLPFLFKVLSIRKALSIQAHPDKKLAEQLHARDSKNYPDDNHKPEMTIAITPFDGLCGFRPLAEIAHFLSTVPSLQKLVGEATSKAFQEAIQGRDTSDLGDDKDKNKKALRDTFSALMNTDKEKIEAAAKDLIESAKKEGEEFAGGGGPSNGGKELADLVVRLDGQFPGDIGLFVLFFLNYIKMEPGEAMFLKADDIHAYLSGDIIECMAASDNVVRAGFTPKFKDISTLISMLTYNYAPISEQKMSPVDYPYVTLSATAYSSNSSVILYDPPIEEFSVGKTELRKPGAKATFEPIAGPSIVICTEGGGKICAGGKVEEVKEGFVFFAGAGAEVVLESGTEEPFVTFKAFCELGGKEDDGKAERNGRL
ncbi:MAG: Mannose-6-phosphate isomerase [Thelocarpon impressellum]|nr:MAG: Mannose-6-phosphate isomerase [Thelocarpon impressellum]